jgi:N-acetyl-anhydromuramyl-L-alanine amidase AmpD
MLKPIQKLPTVNKYDLDEPAYIIILHTTLGSYDSAVDWLRNQRGQNPNSSAHFVVGRLGETAQLAELNEGTWHAGRVFNPSFAAKNVCRKDIFGRVQNPNKYSIGIEVACGYDIDRDGVLESWEKLYSPQQITQVAELILDIEKKTGQTFSSSTILTHRDIASYKPNLDIQKAMVISKLSQLRSAVEPTPTPAPEPTPAPTDSTTTDGNTFVFEQVSVNTGETFSGVIEDGILKITKD